MRTTLIIPVLNQFDLVRANLEVLTKNNESDDFEILIIDNGSDEVFESDLPNVRVIRFDEPVGSYPIFKIGLENTSSDVLAFIHSDFIIWNPRWFAQVENAFKGDSKLGLMGMIGSNEIDIKGGRGGGTMGSFQGRTLAQNCEIGDDVWTGSPASAHGQDVTGQLRNAAVLDGCSMIFRRAALESIPLKDDYLFHHFYDRIISCQILEAGWKIAVLGVECDHIGGKTVNGSDAYEAAAKKWALAHNLIVPDKIENWDSVIYADAERKFLSEFRDNKHFIPIKV